MDGADLKARRTALGLSQAQMAERLRVSIDTLQNWEQGRRGMAAVAGLVDLVLTQLEREASVDESTTLGFTTITDAYAAFEEYFGSEPCAWTRDQFQTWLQAYGHRRYEDIDRDVMDAAYAACIASSTGE